MTTSVDSLAMGCTSSTSRPSLRPSTVLLPSQDEDDVFVVLDSIGEHWAPDGACDSSGHICAEASAAAPERHVERSALPRSGNGASYVVARRIS